MMENIFLKITCIPIDLFFVGQKVYKINEIYNEISVGEIYNISNRISILWKYGRRKGSDQWLPDRCYSTYIKIGKCKKLKQLLSRLENQTASSFKINWAYYTKDVKTDFFGY